MRLLMLHILFVLLMLAGNTYAGNSSGAQHNFSGFASLGVVSSDSEELVFRRDVTQNDGSYDGKAEWLTDSLIGAQWHGRWSHQWDTTIQVVAKDRFDNTLEKSIEWAFVRYRPMDGLDLRLGRVGTDIFTISEYRQVGYASPWVRPQHDTYALLSLYHFDGGDITKRFDLDESTLNVKLFYGNSDEKYPLAFKSDDSVRLDFDMGGITLNLEQGNWKWRTSFIDVAINNNAGSELGAALAAFDSFWPEAGAISGDFYTEGKHFTYGEVGISYDNNSWWVQAEAVRLDSDTLLIPSGHHAYLMVGKRLGDFSVYALGGYAQPEKDPVSLQPPPGLPSPQAEAAQFLAMTAERTLNGARIDQRSLGLGVRWDFASKMALKFQVENFEIHPDGTNYWFRVNSQELIDSDQSSIVTSLAWDMLF